MMVIRIRPVAPFVFLLFILLSIATVSIGMGESPAAQTVSVQIKVPATRDSAAPTEALTAPSETAVQEEEVYIPRLEAPARSNACYYSDENIFYACGYGMPNCTCYAWGRAYELCGEKPELSPNDACMWFDYNRENAIYSYGDEPREGAIACFAYADGGSGHVAVVEEIGADTLTLSNSAYSGTEFYTETVPRDDPTDGRDNWIFQGYIYPE